MTTEEAREAAWRGFATSGRGYVSVPDGFYSGFAAGVVEGIRRAREAVQKVYDEDSLIEPPAYWVSLGVALDDIDALSASEVSRG